jgi:hypothetical protein
MPCSAHQDGKRTRLNFLFCRVPVTFAAAVGNIEFTAINSLSQILLISGLAGEKHAYFNCYPVHSQGAPQMCKRLLFASGTACKPPF